MLALILKLSREVEAYNLEDKFSNHEVERLHIPVNEALLVQLLQDSQHLKRHLH